MRTFLACFISAFFVFSPFTSTWAQEFEYKDYTVQKGDTLWDIATLYSTTVEALVAANGLEGGVLRVGMVIRVPRS